MTERKKMLLDAIEGMTWQYPVYYDEKVIRHLVCDEGAPEEVILLAALAEMVDKCLGRNDDGSTRYDDQVDTLAESGPEDAVLALAEFGLMERLNVRFGRWTPAGKKFLVESMREWEQRKDRIRTESQAREHARQARWAKYALVAASIVVGSGLAGWIAFSGKFF